MRQQTVQQRARRKHSIIWGPPRGKRFSFFPPKSTMESHWSFNVQNVTICITWLYRKYVGCGAMHRSKTRGGVRLHWSPTRRVGTQLWAQGSLSHHQRLCSVESFVFYLLKSLTFSLSLKDTNICSLSHLIG